MDVLSEIMGVVKIDQIAYAGVVLFVILAILTGRLFSKAAMDEVRLERDQWKQAYFESEKANRELMDQNGELIDAAKTTTRVIESLPQIGERGATG